MTERLTQQLDFLKEVDRLKQVYRQNRLMDNSRRENDAEHSWHLAVMALILQEYCSDEVDLGKVLKMVLIHDLVEIEAGDTFCYDQEGQRDKEARERKAAQLLYERLPQDQAWELKSLWQEFEERKTAEARFAACLDRLQPFLNNYHLKGGTWRGHSVCSGQVRRRMAAVGEICPELGDLVVRLLEDAVSRGFLKE